MYITKKKPKRRPGRPKGSGEGLKSQMRLPLTPELHEAVKKAAEAAGIDATAWVRKQIERGLVAAPATAEDLLLEAIRCIEVVRRKVKAK